MKIKNLLSKKISQWALLCAMLIGGGSLTANADDYYLRGDFNNWEATKLTLDTDGYYKSDFYDLNSGDTRRFKITNNNGSCWDKNTCAWFEWESNPSKGPTTCETPSHSDGIQVKATTSGKVKIWFNASTKKCAYYFEAEDRYYLRGDFNSWGATKLTLDTDGYYKSDFYDLNSGDTRRFKITNNNGSCWDKNTCAWFEWESNPNKGPTACDRPSHDDGIQVKATINGRVCIWFDPTTKKCAYYFESKYIVAGSPTSVFGGTSEWLLDRTENQLHWDGEYYSATFPEASSGTTIKLKVTKNKSWDGAKGGNDYSDASPTKLNDLGTITTDGSGNLVITPTSDISSFTVKFNETNIYIILAGSCTPTGYAIGGYINGGDVTSYSAGIKMTKYQYTGYDEMWSAVTSFTKDHDSYQWIWLFDDCNSVKSSGKSGDITVGKDDGNGVTLGSGKQGKIKAQASNNAIYNFIYNPTTNKFYFYKIKVAGDVTGGWGVYNELETGKGYNDELVRHKQYKNNSNTEIAFKLSNGHGYDMDTETGGHAWGYEYYNSDKSTLCASVNITEGTDGNIVINNPKGKALDIDIYFNEQEQIYLNITASPVKYILSVNSVSVSETAIFTLSGSESGVSYQLYKDGTPMADYIKNGTGSAITFEIANVTTANNGSYTVVATDPVGSKTSETDPVELEVAENLTITADKDVVHPYEYVTLTAKFGDEEVTAAWEITENNKSYFHYDSTPSGAESVQVKCAGISEQTTVKATYNSLEATYSVTTTPDEEICH